VLAGEEYREFFEEKVGVLKYRRYRRNGEILERAIYRGLFRNLQTTNEEQTRAIQQKSTDNKAVIHGREQLLALFPGLTINDSKFSGSLDS